MSKVQVDKVVNLSDDGAPQLTYGAELPVGYGLTGAGGLNITGVVTAASAVFSGNVTIGGTLTYEDVTNIDVVGVSTFAGRMNVNSSALFNEGLSVTAGVTTIAGTSTFAKKTTVNATLEATEGLNITAGVSTFAGTTTHNEDVTFTGANYNALWDKSKSALILNDNAQLNFGTDEDGDIYHDNSQMIINNATGVLRIRSSEVRLCNPTNSTYFTGTSGGSAKVYFNDAVKIETTNSGTITTGIGTFTQNFGNVCIDSHATGSGRGSQIKLQNDHGVAYVGTAGDTSGNLLIWNASASETRFATNDTERLRIDSVGNISIRTGISTFSGAGTLRINSGSTTGLLTLDGGASNHGGEIGLYGGSNGGRILFRAGQGAGQQDEKMRLTENGQLSIGESTPDVSAGGLCLNQGTADTNIFSLKSSDITHGVTTLDETDTYFSIRKSSGDKGGARIHGFTDAAGSDPALELYGIINSDADQGYCPIELKGAEANGTGVQNIAVDRRIVQIKNSDGTRIASFTGTGLTFGNDSAEANALDDYEKGDFTATCANSVTLYASANQLAYVKIGNLCHVQGQVRVQSSNSNSDFIITNLPFTATNPTDAGGHSIGAVRLYEVDTPSNTIGPFCSVYDGEINLNFRTTRDNDTDIAIPAKDNGYFAFGITYRTVAS